MFEFENLSRVNEGMDKWFADCLLLANETFRGLSVLTFQYVLERTPQAYGRAVSNWRYSVNSVDTSVDLVELRHWENKDYPFIQGDWPGQDYALRQNAARDGRVLLTDTIYISNSVDHGEGAYAWKLENGEISFRPGNLPHMLSSAVEKANAENLVITEAKAKALGRLNLA